MVPHLHKHVLGVRYIKTYYYHFHLDVFRDNYSTNYKFLLQLYVKDNYTINIITKFYLQTTGEFIEYTLDNSIKNDVTYS